MLDKFYTNRDVAENCFLRLKPYLNDHYLIEPSAGSGNFVFDESDLCLDILPEANYIRKENWLNFDTSNIQRRICVYGNPPFGKRNGLSKAFIEKSVNCNNTDIVAFLLPLVFEKHTLQKAFPSEWVLVEKFFPPKESFTSDGEPYGIDCVFQIWIRGSTLPNLRSIERKEEENAHFSFCSKDDADLFVFGAAPRKIIDPGQVNKNNRGYFLKSKIGKEQLTSNLLAIKWKMFSSAAGGVAWLTKTDFLNNYERSFPNGKQ